MRILFSLIRGHRGVSESGEVLQIQAARLNLTFDFVCLLVVALAFARQVPVLGAALVADKRLAFVAPAIAVLIAAGALVVRAARAVNGAGTQNSVSYTSLRLTGSRAGSHDIIMASYNGWVS